jgi:two-component sensor histidine kinase
MLGYTKKELIGNKLQDIGVLLDLGDFQTTMQHLNMSGIINYDDVPVKTKSGQHIDTDIYLVDRARLVQCNIRDITDRKQAEVQFHASLREKDILLREIHHRVKNNMQVIIGLLDLQASSSGNPELMEMLNKGQSRIRSMALVHEKLYASKDFTRINLAGYLRTLSQDLFQSYKINPGKIDLIIQTDGVYVDINKAIPCGLVLNELISNVLKHAFPGDRQGELQIIIREEKNTEMEIVVRDNGMGLPDDVDIHQPRTMGLNLVNGLVKKQLKGQMEVRRDNGTEIRIKFPL